MMWKKTLAVLVAGATLTSMLSFPAFAQAEEEIMPIEEVVEKIREKHDNIGSNLGKGIETVSTPIQSQKLSIKLGDSVKGLAQMLIGLNLNELDSIDLLASAKLEDKTEQVEMSLGINEKPILSGLLNINFETMNLLCAIPELSSKALLANLKEMLDENDVQMLEGIGGLVSNNAAMTEELDPDELVEALNKYDSIVLDHLDVLTEEWIDLEYVDVSQEVAEYCLDLPDDHYVALAKDLVENFKNDEFFGPLLDKMEETPFVVDGEEITLNKDELFDILDSIVEDLEKTYKDAEGNTGLLFYVDYDEDLIPRGFQMDSYMLNEDSKDYEHTALFIFQCPIQDGVTAVNAYTSFYPVTFSGIGSKAEDGTFSGYYYVYYQDEEIAEVEVLDYYSDDDSMGVSFILKPAEVEGGDENEDDEMVASIKEMLTMIQGFTLYCDYSLNGKESYVELGLNYGEDNYVALSLTGYDPADVKFTDISEYKDTADLYDEKQVDEFLASIDISKIFENIEAAGISQETLAALMELFG